MLRIVVKSTEVQSRSGNAKRSGKPYTMRTQHAWVDLGKAFPQEVRITLGDEQAPFPVGEYTLSPQCFLLNQWGELGVSLQHMTPRKADASLAKAG